jgi:general secretion pathway protein L
LTVEFTEQAILLTLYDGNTGAIMHSKTVDWNDELAKAGIASWVARIKRDHMECVVLAQRNRILTKSLTLPPASEADLLEIIGFEMDRQTPFTIDQVYYCARIVLRDLQQNKITVDLYVATRAYIDGLLNDLRSWSLTASVVSFRNATGPAAINLLPPEARAAIVNKPDPITLAAVAGACALFIASLYLPLWHQQNALEKLNAEVSASREQALAVQPLLAEREAILARTSFLSEQRRSRVSVVILLAELTRLLPDDTYLERLTLRGDELRIQGESANATSIIELVENSEYFQNVQPRSPVTKNPMTHKEKFQLSAILVTPPVS